ncbi:MAG: Crp/Fnr family transcriptional regulator [Candidatus Promineifilaceae bacterium]|nr:Crp/Fnr family transcriptional regulator [Candidatus Promineifilaceae bacterium]
MLSDKISQIVADSPILANLNPAETQLFLEQGRPRRAGKGTFLFQQDELATTFYILTSGRVRLVQLAPDGQQVILNYFGPGDGIGIIVALSQMAYPATAEVLEDSEALSWDADSTRELMRQIPRLAINGMEMIAHRFARLQERYLEMATQQVEQRIALTLLRLVRQFGKRVDDGVLIDMPLTRQELAEMTGTNLYSVSRILSKWEQAGTLRSERKRILLCRAHDLVMLTQGRD